MYAQSHAVADPSEILGDRWKFLGEMLKFFSGMPKKSHSKISAKI